MEGLDGRQFVEAFFRYFCKVSNVCLLYVMDSHLCPPPSTEEWPVSQGPGHSSVHLFADRQLV